MMMSMMSMSMRRKMLMNPHGESSQLGYWTDVDKSVSDEADEAADLLKNDLWIIYVFIFFLVGSFGSCTDS